MDSASTLTSERGLWAVALWVEKHHGDDGLEFIGEQIVRLSLDGDVAGVAMWERVAERFEALQGSYDCAEPF